MTTGPNPGTRNALSIGSLVTASSRPPERAPRAASTSVALSFSRPSPVRADTGTMGADSRKDPRVSSRTSAAVTSTSSGPARSILVRATTPAGIPSMRTISKCSRVWGITDSSAATTSRTAWMPPAPASMLRTKRSWPGTSTKDMRTPSHSACAKPRSIVMPRRFSSGRRSASIPVSAFTSEVLPWSMWPAVPIRKRRTRYRLSPSAPRRR